MPLKLTKKPNPKAPEYTRVYLKLVALEFDVRDILGNRVKSGMSPQQLEHQHIERAKSYYRQVYKSLCIDLTQKEWEIDADIVHVQTCDIFREPDFVLRVPFDSYITMVYSRETFKVTDAD
jgi:hypothetical protein